MPAPTGSLATLRPDLAGGLMQWDIRAEQQGFIGYQCLPVIETAVQSGPFGKIPVAQLLQSRTVTRAPGSAYSRGNFTFGTDTFACQEYGAEEAIDDREAAMYANYFDAELISTFRAYDAVMRAAEIRIAALLQDTATYADAAASVAWSTAATAVPITDVETGVQNIWAASGVWPNAICMTRKTFRNLRNVAQIIDRVKYSGLYDPTPAKITPQAIANAFDLEHVLIAGSAKNSATEGQTASLGSLWTDSKVTIFRIAETQDLREPCVGRAFHWAADGSAIGGTVETYRDETVRGDVVRCRHDVHEKILYPELGYIVTGC